MNKFFQFLKKQKIILILLLIVFILALISLGLKKKDQPSIPTTPEAETSPLPAFSPQPSPSPEEVYGETPVAEQEVKESLELYPLIEYLPLDNERYHLTYSNPFELEITVKKGSAETIKQEVSDWMASQGADPESHKIVIK